MISLIACHNDISTIKALQKELANIVDEEMNEKFGRHNAAVWAEIFSKITELEGYVPDTVINGIVKRAEEKYGNIPDTKDNLTRAIHFANYFKEKTTTDFREIYSFLEERMEPLRQTIRRNMVPWEDHFWEDHFWD